MSKKSSDKKTDPKKQISQVKKEIQGKVKKFAQKTKKDVEKAKKLKEEEKELAKKKKKDLSPDEKKQAVDIRKILDSINKSYLREITSINQAVNQVLQTQVPDDKEELPEWKKGMASWYREMIEKESGLDLGKDVKLWGDISFEKKEATIIFKGKF